VFNQARHTHDGLVHQGDEAGWNPQPAHPRPKTGNSIRDGEMGSERLPFIVVPLSESWNGVTVVSKVLDFHKKAR